MEIEAKFGILDEQTFERLLQVPALAGLSLGPATESGLQDTYLDTPDRAILAGGYSCRIRRDGDRVLVTVKSLGDADGGIHRRAEHEIELPDLLPPGDWPPGTARDVVLRLSAGRPLNTLFVLSQTRYDRPLADGNRQVARVSLDRVRLHRGDSPEPATAYLELEAELLPDGREEDLMAVAAELQQAWHLSPENRSKFQRALALVDDREILPTLVPAASQEAEAGLNLSADERAALERLAGGNEATARRARLLLAQDDGLARADALDRSGLSPRRARHWLDAFRDRRLGIFPRRKLKAVQVEPEGPPPAEPAAELAAELVAEPEGQSPAEPEEQLPAVPAAELVAEPEEQPPAAPAAELVAEPEGQPPAEPEGQPPAEPEGQPPAEPEEQPPAAQAAELLAEPEKVSALTVEVSVGAAEAGEQIWPAPVIELLKAPGLEPDDPMSEAGRKTFRLHYRRMLFNEPGTRRGEDPEALHDMRVATRRMRAAFRLFGSYYDPQVAAPLEKGLRQAGRMLGAVRDLDVFREKVQAYLDSLPEEQRPDLDLLLSTLETRRDLSREQMIEYLDGGKYARLKERMTEFVETEGLGSLPISFEGDEPRPYRVRQMAPLAIYERLAVLRAFDEWVSVPNPPVTRLHALRIAAKKLRYTVEYFREVLGPESKEFVTEVVELQDHLGALQDAVVASGILRDLLVWGTWGEPHTRSDWADLDVPIIAPGVAAYLAVKQSELQRLLTDFPALWERFHDPEFSRLAAMAVSVL